MSGYFLYKVFQDTADVIRGYGDQIISIQQPDLSEPEVPSKETKFKGYFKIARSRYRQFNFVICLIFFIFVQKSYL